MSQPSLSVILISPDCYGTLSKTVAHLQKQTISTQIELVLVFPDRKSFQPDTAELTAFHNCTFVETPVTAVGAAFGAGVRHARAPVVALGEDHSFPQPGWAEALVNAHRLDWAAVGPAISNANPHSVVSVADLLCAYGPWLHPSQGGVQRHLPGHNSTYKRVHLLEYGDRLDEMLESESVLHWDLVRRGYKLFLEPSAVTAHTNFELWSSWVPVQFHSGRVFASSRAQNQKWPLLRRFAFAVCWPLIPLIRFRRILAYVVSPGRNSRNYLSAMPALLVGLFVSGAGEGMGYLFGAGPSLERMVHFEFHRDMHRRIGQPGQA